MEPMYIQQRKLQRLDAQKEQTHGLHRGQRAGCCSINDENSLRYKDKNIPTAGPFVIEVRGTAIIENPRCAGQ